jgi:hypothetical protein|tara:strand:- start:1223 stop:1711 length:489 start_codon:yes stop_codon:yes gene_type:complete
MKKHVNKNRSFDRLQYIMYDKKARDAMIYYLNKHNYTDIVSVENYNFDVSAKKDKEHFFEVEVKTQWKGTWNPLWKEIRIPERKQRLINIWKEKYPEHDFKFVVFDYDLKKAWFIDADEVDKSPVGTIQNSRFTNAPHLKEPFFHIPLDKAQLVHIIEEKDG